MLKSDPLWYLVQVGHYQSLTIASEKLHVTQPTLSIAIKNLEKELGVKLMNRTANGVILTHEGETIATLAQKAFVHFEEIENFALNIKTKASADLAVYSTLALNTTLMPQLINLYYSLYPNGAFHLYPLGEDNPTAIITRHPQAFVIGIFNESRLFDEPFESIVLDKSKAYLAMSPHSPYVSPNINSISVKELLQIPLIITAVAEEQSFQTEMLNTIRKYGEPNIRFTSSSMDLSTPLVLQEIGATLYVSFKYFQNPHTANYRLLSIKNTPKFVLSLLYDKNQMPPETLALFLDLLRQNGFSI